LTFATGIRFLTFSSCGVLVGWFANEHRRHLEQLRTLAERDFLTGILNTRVFDEALARRCASGRPFVLLLGDMDNLKAVNDTHGHTAGNSELRRLADALGDAVSDGDELARSAVTNSRSSRMPLCRMPSACACSSARSWRRRTCT
jgi:predicted signal transduction protein with EAL and GGDEF domain